MKLFENGSYLQVRENVQNYMKDHFSTELDGAQELTTKNDEQMENRKYVLLNQIKKYIIENDITCREMPDIKLLVKAVFMDMAQFGALTDFLNRIDIEEININAFNDIDIIFRGGKKEKRTDIFYTAEDATNIIRKLLRIQSGVVLDASKPIANADLNSNIRICAIGDKIVDHNVGIAVSIRFVGRAEQTKKTLIDGNTANDEMLMFLSNCINHGISVCIGGATFAGKTNTAAYLLSTIPSNMRVVTIEEGSREIDLVKYNEKGERTNSVVHLCTINGDNEENSVTQADLLRASLNLHPDVIFIGQMLSKEAYIAQETARTGHTTLTTVHCNSAPLAYTRMVTLAKEAVDFRDEFLLRLMIEAFPIIVFQKWLKNGTRKIMQIIEAETIKDGEVQFRTLWQYNMEKETFEKTTKISDRLRQTLIDNEVPLNEVNAM